SDHGTGGLLIGNKRAVSFDGLINVRVRIFIQKWLEEKGRSRNPGTSGEEYLGQVREICDGVYTMTVEERRPKFARTIFKKRHGRQQQGDFAAGFGEFPYSPHKGLCRLVTTNRSVWLVLLVLHPIPGF